MVDNLGWNKQTNNWITKKSKKLSLPTGRQPESYQEVGMMVNADRGQASYVITSLLFVKNKS